MRKVASWRWTRHVSHISFVNRWQLPPELSPEESHVSIAISIRTEGKNPYRAAMIEVGFKKENELRTRERPKDITKIDYSTSSSFFLSYVFNLPGLSFLIVGDRSVEGGKI